ncbi:MAG: hypothetical protein AAGG02_03300 [Cyanobacteria bacterium P01_H01_bin.15]
MTILEWMNGLYEEHIFKGTDVVVSTQMPTFQLNAQQVLSAGS